MRDYYLCYPAILTNTLVPQPGLSSILQNQPGVELDALTMSPFFVIVVKPVEVFNGDKSMWNCKELRHCLHKWQKAPPEDVHINVLRWNANAHGRLYLWRSSSPYEDNKSCINKYTGIMICIMKNGRLQYDFVRDLSLHMRNLSSHHRIENK